MAGSKRQQRALARAAPAWRRAAAWVTSRRGGKPPPAPHVCTRNRCASSQFGSAGGHVRSRDRTGQQLRLALVRHSNSAWKALASQRPRSHARPDAHVQGQRRRAWSAGSRHRERALHALKELFCGTALQRVPRVKWHRPKVGGENVGETDAKLFSRAHERGLKRFERAALAARGVVGNEL